MKLDLISFRFICIARNLVESELISIEVGDVKKRFVRKIPLEMNCVAYGEWRMMHPRRIHISVDNSVKNTHTQFSFVELLVLNWELEEAGCLFLIFFSTRVWRFQITRGIFNVVYMKFSNSLRCFASMFVLYFSVCRLFFFFFFPSNFKFVEKLTYFCERWQRRVIHKIIALH